MTGVLYVAVKAPRPGFAKTRLARTVGTEAGLRLYEAFLRDLAERFAAASFPVGWYVTPPDAWPEIAPFAAPLGPGAGVIAQGSGDWAVRQDALFAGAAARGEERTILIGSDSPQLTIAAVSRAFELLRGHELVLGPTLDGGYCLIGMRGHHDVLRGTRMSTGLEMGEIAARAQGRGLRVAELEPTFDVDVESDLDRLRAAVDGRADLAHTRRALCAMTGGSHRAAERFGDAPSSGGTGTGSSAEDAEGVRRVQRR